MTCLIVDDEKMSRQIISHFIERTEGLELVKVCESAIEAANFLQQNAVDVVFLDIEMPEMSGMDLIKSLEIIPQVVLITSRTDYAIEAFEHNVVDYLVKPVEYARFVKAVAKVRENLQTQQTEAEDLYVKSESKIVKINLKELLYVEALADYVILHTSAQKYIVHSTMKGIEKRLPEKNFIRIHRSYIVNTDKIEHIEDLSVVINKKYLPIGNSYKDAFMKRLNIL
jgi:DNA-binding LytR/AlgR family response regulator